MNQTKNNKNINKKNKKITHLLIWYNYRKLLYNVTILVFENSKWWRYLPFKRAKQWRLV